MRVVAVSGVSIRLKNEILDITINSIEMASDLILQLIYICIQYQATCYMLLLHV